MSPFYTRNGDDGYTGLLGPGRVPKEHPRLEAVGALDEANAALGVARFACQKTDSKSILLAVQRDIYHLMAEVAALPENAARFRKIDAGRVTWLEQKTEAISQLVKVPEEFIVPGDSSAGAAIDLARTIVRRAERRTAELIHQNMVENKELLRYLNRLSSLCFVLELFENQAAGQSAPTIAKETQDKERKKNKH